jgi:hypothetical protein
VIERRLSMTEIALIAGTRVALGIGIGLILSARLNNDERRAAGIALAIVGGLSTIPLAIGVLKKDGVTREALRDAA